MKAIKKQLVLKKGLVKPKPKRQSKKRESKALTKEIIDHDDISSNDENVSLPPMGLIQPPVNKKLSKKEQPVKDEVEIEKKAEVKKEKKKQKKNSGPMHFTANHEPRALTGMGDLDPAIFNEVNTLITELKMPDNDLNGICRFGLYN